MPWVILCLIVLVCAILTTGRPPQAAASASETEARLERADGSHSSPDERRTGPGDGFSLVILPDTQFYSEQTPGCQDIYQHQAEWIGANRASRNIQFVVHVGDLTDDNTLAQWVVADAAHAIVERHGVPYSVALGNHDLIPQIWRRDTTNFNDYFGPWRFASAPWYGGSMQQGANENNVTFFDAQGLKFMVLSLELSPTKEALCWANRTIAQHPDRRVIVVTHCYQGRGGFLNCTNRYKIVGSDGEHLWDELISRHSNIFLVLSGHYPGSESRQRFGAAGNVVHEILTDYQREKPLGTGPNCGNGWLRVLRFLPDEDRIEVSSLTVEQGNALMFPEPDRPRFFLASYNPDPAHPDHRYSVSYPMRAPLSPNRQDLSLRQFNDMTVNSARVGQQRNPDLAMDREGNFVVAWESEQDGKSAIVLRGHCRDGCARLPEALASAADAGRRANPAVAMNETGAFVVVWQEGREGDGDRIEARWFASDGTPGPAALRVDSGPGNRPRQNPDVAMDRWGRFVVVWQEDADGDGLSRVRSRGFFPDGREWLPEAWVSPTAAEHQEHPAIAMDAEGDFVVVWQGTRAGSSPGINGRSFHPGLAWPRDMRIDSDAGGGGRGNPAVGMDADANVVVAWQEDSMAADLSQIRVRGIGPSGTVRFPEMEVNSIALGRQERPALAVGEDGSFVVAWQDDQDNNGEFQIFARGLNPLGREIFHDLAVNSESAGQQVSPSLAFRGGNRFVVSWQDDLDGNGDDDILARGVVVSGDPVWRP